MIRLDTIKLLIPTDSVRSYHVESFDENHRIDGKTGEVTVTGKGKSHALPVGMAEISYKQGADFQMTISAKTLKDDYLQGININTWQSAFQAVRSVIDIDTNKLWDANPVVYVCDTTDNLLLERLRTTQKGVCQALQSAKMNDRFLSVPYNTTKKLGIEFRGTQTEKNRLNVYSKHLDLLHPKNKQFMASLTNPVRMMHDAENTIRIETNHTAFNSIRTRFGINENNLQSILTARLPVNHNFMKKVLSVRSGQMTLFDEFNAMNVDPMAFIRIKGIETIIHELGNDEIEVKQFFKRMLGERFKYFFYKSAYPIKELILKAKTASETVSTNETMEICQRVLDELKVA